MLNIIFLSAALFVSSACSSNQTSQANAQGAGDTTDISKYSVATFASGCFWCVEAVYESVEGVAEAVSGYAGGNEKNPTYEEVSAGRTGHAEAVQVYYDPKVISFRDLVVIYFGSQNPTQVNGQGPDNGRQYRSIIFYNNENEKIVAEGVKREIENSGKYNQPLAAEIVPFEKFYEAEAYHQNYERLNPNQPYVRAVSIPRLRKFQEAYPQYLKKQNAH